MNIRSLLCILFTTILLTKPLFAQKADTSDYYRLKLNYENGLENDSTLLPFVKRYIQRARSEKNYRKLIEGYKDGLVFSPSAKDKLKYADSAIWAARRLKEDNLIGRAYATKGTVYYFNLKKYKLALDEFLIAYEYSKRSNDPYYKNKIAYLLGVVKSYIGYYDEALVLFRQTKMFFEQESEKNLHPNLRYGNQRGYYNSLHQMAVCYRNLGRLKSADSLINIGLSLTTANKEYQQEYGYFLKERGIAQFYSKDYGISIKSLSSSIKSISQVNDFAWTTVCYFYIGKSYLEVGERSKAVEYFKKVDSVFNKHNFILPEVRNVYEILINHYKREGDTKKQLYYTDQLIKADEILVRDFTHLSSTIHRNYDANILLEGKSELERKVIQSIWVTWIFATLAVALVILLLIRYRKERIIRQKYELLEQKILARKDFLANEEPAKEIKVGPEQNKVDDILSHLRKFEENLGFIENGISLNILAKRFDTNQNYLSQVVNEYKGTNFKRYISELRIAYITDKLYNDKKYLRYKIKTLAEECGIASRNNFSDLFESINGMKPTDFIKKRLEDISHDKAD